MQYVDSFNWMKIVSEIIPRVHLENLGNSKQSNPSHEMVVKLYEPHKKVHTLSKEIIHAVNSGNRSNIDSYLRELNEATTELINGLKTRKCKVKSKRINIFIRRKGLLNNHVKPSENRSDSDLYKFRCIVIVFFRLRCDMFLNTL